MKFTKKLAALALVGALFGGGAVAVTDAAPAEAHTPKAWATCDALYVEASNYESKPATEDQTEQQIVKEAVPYQPAVYGEKPVITPAVEYQPAVYGERPIISEAVEYQPAVYEIEYEFRHKLLYWKTHWSTNPNWNAESNENSLGWKATGATRNGKLISAEVQAQDAVYGEAPLISPEVPAQDAVYGEAPLITPEVPAQDAVYETVVTVPGSPADTTPNTVVVTINGETVASESFGGSYADEFTFEDKYVANNWTVTITAWNDPDGSKGWTQTISGTTTPCEQPPGTAPANPQADLTAVCGSADVTLTNPLVGDGEQLTASFIVNIDGEFHQAYSVEAGDSVTDSFEFGEDTGNHVVEVFQAGTSEWKSIAKTDVASDCILPQPDDVIVEEQVTPLIPCDAVEGDEIPTTTNVTTTEYVLVEGEWVAGEPVVTTKDSVYVVTAADAEAAECPVVVPPKPEPVVVIDVTTPLIPCDAEVGDEINTTATITTTDYVLVDNVWVLGEPRVTNIAAPYMVTAEDVEGLECPVVVPPKPEDKVTVGEWPTPSINCTAEVGDSIAISREVTTTPYILVDNVWVLDTANAVVTYEEGTYTVTAEDIEALECPVVEPPVVEPPVVKPPVVEPPVVEPPAPKPAVVKVAKTVTKEDDSILAQTGGEIAGWTLGSALVALLLGGLLVSRRRKA